MKTKLCILIFMLAAMAAPAQTNRLTALLQQGLFEEQASRNLPAAISNYSALATQFDQDRQLAATAVFRIGECYRMEGRTNEAAAQYQRILRDFSDQTTLATLSRQNLTGMGMATPVKGISSEAMSAAQNSDVALWNKLKDSKTNELENILPTLVPDATLDRLLQQRNETQAKIAELQTDYSPLNPMVTSKKALLEEINRQISQKISGMMLALKMRAEIAQSHSQERLQSIVSGNTQGAEAATTDEEEQEIRRIQTMVKNSPDLINATSEGVTPLGRAAGAGWLRVTAFLLDHGAALDQSALFYATSKGNKAMVEFLLDHGADINAKDGEGATALHRAVFNGYLSVAAVLIQRGANLEARKSTQNQEQTPLHRAVSQGHQAMVELLVNKGADVNASDLTGRTAIMMAVNSGYVEIIRKLLKAGAKPDIEDKSNRTALSYAAEKGNVDCIKALLAAKADPNAGKYGAAVFAAAGQPESLKLLLAAGANPNFKAHYYGTPLMVAIVNGQAESAAMLVEHGADVNKAGDNGMTPLQRAIWLQNIPIISMLLSNKVDVNARHPSGRTALEMSKEAEGGSRPFNPGQYDGLNGSSDREIAKKISFLLREHGALDNLPDLDRITVSRPAANFSQAVFQQGTNDWNQFTLLETILNFYSHSGSSPNTINGFYNTKMPFPDFANLTVMRPSHVSTNVTKIEINLLNSTNGIDCAKDVPLQFGDVVQIPERDHALGDQPIGPTYVQDETIAGCLTGTVQLVVHRQKAELAIYPNAYGSLLTSVIQQSAAQNVLLSSSDLSRVKVIRHNAKTGKSQEWIIDCRTVGSGNDHDMSGLWLRNGDVIEVPEKP